MKRFKRICVRIMMAGMVLGLFGCSFEGSQYSPEQVIQNALDEKKEIDVYYAESETIVREKGKGIERSFMKEWRADDGKIRIEMSNEGDSDKVIAVNDGETLILYEVDSNQASMIDDPELINLNLPSLKEQANQVLKMVGDTPEISIEDEGEIAGREAYKMLAKVNGENTLIGDLELWIDKENWMVLKTVRKGGDTESETIYTKVDFKTDFPNDLFSIDLPEDVELQDHDDLAETTEITLDEVSGSIGSSFFYFPEVDGVEIAKIELDELHGEIERNEVNIEYTKEDAQLLSLTVFKSPEETDDDIGLEMPEETTIEIRGHEGIKVELNDFRLISWQEEGVSYSVMPYDLDLTLEEIIDMTNRMVLVE